MLCSVLPVAKWVKVLWICLLGKHMFQLECGEWAVLCCVFTISCWRWRLSAKKMWKMKPVRLMNVEPLAAAMEPSHSPHPLLSIINVVGVSGCLLVRTLFAQDQGDKTVFFFLLLFIYIWLYLSTLVLPTRLRYMLTKAEAYRLSLHV